MNKFAIESALQTGESTLTNVLGDEIRPFVKYGFTKKADGEVDVEKIKLLFAEAFHAWIDKHQDKKIGVQLSGGLDSSFGAFLIKALYPDADITAYYNYNGEENRDEREYAKIAANFAGVPLKIINIDYMDGIVSHSEIRRNVPTIRSSGLYVYPFYRQVAKDGVEVLANFTGPDEYFGGYNIHTRWYDRYPLHVYPISKTKWKYSRYMAILFGRDKPWFVNNAMLAPGHAHIVGSDWDATKYYEKVKKNTLWNTINYWLMLKVAGNYQTLLKPAAEAFGMETAYPYISEKIVRYIFTREPKSVRNKKPFREILDDYGLPPEITKRGEDYAYGHGGKVGWGVNEDYYTKHKHVQDMLLRMMTKFKFWNEYFTPYVKDNYKKWIKTHDRRALQIWLLITQMD